jgi:hypothetical protein
MTFTDEHGKRRNVKRRAEGEKDSARGHSVKGSDTELGHNPALPLLPERRKGEKPMITFRNHAIASTDCHVSLLGQGPRKSGAKVPRLAALIIILLVAASGVFASPRQKQQAKGHAAGEPSTQNQNQGEETKEDSKLDAKIPIRLTRLDTPDGPCVLATIGDFPTDLNEAGQEFLKREFFEHFASDVLGLGDSSDTHTTVKVSLLPQEKENQREGDFILGKVQGHMIVVVEKRRVLVACVFEEAQNQPRQMAAVRALAERPTAR